MPGKIFLAFAAACSLSAAVPGVAAAQSITIDGRLSPAQTLVGPNYAITANLGKQVGSNLFHSFGKFGLASSESATFSGPVTVSNVIGRVTGGAQSGIDGKIASTITGASLYLINPSGIVFGPNATVNVSGGFHASTADYLRMSDGAKFQATNPDASTLSAAPPAAFGFLTSKPAALTVNGSSLGVPSGQMLGLVGGPVSISGATLSAPVGTIHVTSAAGTGEVPVDPRNTPALTVTSFGPVNIKSGSTLDVSDPNNLGSGGSVFIRSGALTIDASEINGDNYGSDPGGVISLRGDHQITLSNGAYVHAVAMGSGSGADVLLSTAPSGVISADAATVLTDSSGPGNSGSITIVAGQLALRNGTNVLVLSSGSGSGGGVTVSVGGALTVDTGASLGTVAFADGKAGNVSVTAAGPITIDMFVGSDISLLEGIGSATLGTGNAGDVSVAAGALTIANSGEVSSLSVGGGNSGSVSVNVSGMLSVNGPSGIPQLATGILADAEPGSTGTAGKVTVNAGSLSTLSNGEISASAFGSGNAGSVSVSVAGGLTIDGTGTAPDGVTGISSQADRFSIGNAGAVMVGAGSLSVINGGQISSNNFGPGQGGQVTVVAGALSIAGNGRIASLTAIGSSGTGGSVTVAVAGQLSLDGAGGDPRFLTGISSQTQGSGAAGTVTVTAGALSIANTATIASNTFGSGSGSSVSVMVDGKLTIDGAGVTEAANLLTGITTSSEAGSTGNAGGVTVKAGALSIVNAGLISSSALQPFDNSPASTGNAGRVTVDVAGPLSMGGSRSRIATLVNPGTTGDAGSVTVSAAQITIASGAEIVSTTAGTGAGGSVSVTTPGALVLDGAGVANTQIAASAIGPQSGPGGSVTVGADTLTVAGGAQIASSTAGPGKGGDVTVTVANGVTLSGVGPSGATGITAAAQPGSSGRAGEVALSAGGAIGLSGGAEVTSSTAGAGNGGTVRVTAQGPVTLTDSGSGIVALATSAAKGDAGSVTVSAPQIELVTGAEISSTTAGTGMGGSVMVMTPGALALDGAGVAGTQIAASATGPQSGPGGSVMVAADTLTIAGGAQIASTTASTLRTGKGGDIAVTVANGVTLSGSGPSRASGISAAALPGSNGQAGEVVLTAGGAIGLSNGAAVTSSTAGMGNGGSVQVTAGGPLNLTGSGTGIIASATETASGDAGSVMAKAPQITVISGAEISSTTAGTGAGGPVVVTTPGMLVLDGAGVANTQIAASATGPQSGQGGSVTVGADMLTVEGGAQIASTTASALRTGKGGDIAVTVANGVTLSGSGPNGASGISAAALPGSSGGAGEIILTAGGAIALSSGAAVTSSTAGVGNGGSVQVTAGGPLNLTGSGTGIIASATATASGDAGSVTVSAPQIALVTGSEISSTTAGTGMGGSVSVMTPGALVLDGAGVASTRIAASAIGAQSGPGGPVTVSANSLTIGAGAQIASSTAGPREGGDVTVTVANGVTLSGRGPNGASVISAAALPGSGGQAGEVIVMAGGAIALSNGAEATSSTAGVGNGGSVQVTAGGPLTLTGSGTGVIASATATASGDAGSVIANAPQITVISGAEISSTTAGTGAGGSVVVTTPGMLALDGAGVANTQIAASAIGPRSGSGGSVTVAANSLTIQGGARIASSTAGPGTGGDVNIAVASDILLPDPGPQITARSTGSGDAGSITVSAVRLMMNNGASISTEAETSTANGGNITLHLRDFFYLVSSEISTSVKGETGSGGNIVIDPQLVILNHSSIIAQAIEGHGGNITITADQFIPSSDSIISATSELGISGTIVINGPRVDVNGALVVLSSQLRGRTEVLREACETRGGRPISSLVEAGRGGLPQDPEATLPALYIAGRELNPNPQTPAGAFEPSGSPRHTTARLTMRCG